MIMPMIAPWL